MLSDRYFKIIQLQQTLALFLCASPFRFCPKNRQLLCDQHRYMRFCIPLTMLLLIIMFWVFQLIRYQKLGQTTHFYYYYIYALTLCGLFDMVVAYTAFRRPKHTALFMTTLWDFLAELQGTTG